jgi:hypothetical protein
MSASLLIRQLLKLMLYLHISFGYPYLLAIPGDLTPNVLMPSLKLLCRGSYLAYVYVAMLVLCSVPYSFPMVTNANSKSEKEFHSINE